MLKVIKKIKKKKREVMKGMKNKDKMKVMKGMKKKEKRKLQ
jgi:hypothetical protein